MTVHWSGLAAAFAWAVVLGWFSGYTIWRRELARFRRNNDDLVKQARAYGEVLAGYRRSYAAALDDLDRVLAHLAVIHPEDADQLKLMRRAIKGAAARAVSGWMS